MLACSSHAASHKVFYSCRTTEPIVMLLLFVYFDLLLVLFLGLLGVRVVHK